MPTKDKGRFRYRVFWAASFFGLGLLALYAELFSRETMDLDQRSSWAQRSLTLTERTGAGIKNTSLAGRLPPYLFDAAVSEGGEVELASLLPAPVRNVAGLLNHSALRLKVGEYGGRYTLKIDWASAAGSGLTMALYDDLSRPMGRWSGNEGPTPDLAVAGGIYQLVLSATGALGRDFRLAARARRESTRTNSPSQAAGPEPAIPTLQLTMSPANLAAWESLRRVGYEMMSDRGVPAILPNRRVTATIQADGGVSQARVWLSGQGDRTHLDPRGPSFTVNLRAGPLFRGLSRFKLYNLKSQRGILDYVVASILEDEGVYVPRKLLVNVTFNSRNLGLYVAEELAKTEGHFESHRKHDGQIFANGQLFADLNGIWRSKRALTRGEEVSREFIHRIELKGFAKALALSSRFHLTHALERGELRFYRPILEEVVQPFIRDINVGSNEGILGNYLSLLMHAGWWLRPTVEISGPLTNPKLYPRVPGLPSGTEDYEVGPVTLSVSGVHPSILRFLKQPESRQLFDNYLFYSADSVFQSRFSNRLRQTADAAKAVLKSTRSEAWIARQVDQYSRKEHIVGPAVRAFRKRSRLLVQIQPNDRNTLTPQGASIVTLYNFSPYSADVRLPDYVTTLTPNEHSGKPHRLQLAPSHLFLSAVPHFGADATGLVGQDADEWLPGSRLSTRLVSFEGRRFQDRESRADSFSPLADVRLPADRLADFLEMLQTRSIVTLGGSHVLPAKHQLLVSTPEDIALSKLAEVEKTPETWGLTPEAMPEPDIVLYLLEVVESSRGTIFNYVLSNVSDRPFSVDLNKLYFNESDQGKIRAKLDAAAWLGDRVHEILVAETNLGAAAPIADGSTPRLPSSWLWPGGLRGVLLGPRSPEEPNAALLQYLVPNCSWVQTDARDLVRTQPGHRPVQVLVLEPTRVACPSSLVDSPVGSDLQPVAVFTSNDKAAGRGVQRIGGGKLFSGYENVLASERFDTTPWGGAAVFDHEASTFWRPAALQVDGGYWLAMDLGEGKQLTAISILPTQRQSSSAPYMDGGFIMEASDRAIDDDTWTRLDPAGPATLSPGARGTGWIEMAVSAGRPYRYYRLRSSDPSNLSIRELGLKARSDGISDFATMPIEALIVEGSLSMDRVSDGLRVLRPVRRELHLAESLEIPKNHVLELPAGSVIRFDPGAGILSYGTIRALGSKDSPVRFLPHVPESGFKGIAILGAETRSVFQHATLTGARGGFLGPHQVSGGLSVYRSSVRISDSRLHDITANDGVHLSHSSFLIENSTVERTSSDAIDIDWSFGTVARSNLDACGVVSGDCLDISGSRVRLDEIDAVRASDKGISVGEGSVVDARQLRILNGRIAVAIKDGSIMRIEGCHLTGNEYGILRYIKKPIYTYPELRVRDCDFSENAVARLDEPDTIWTRRYD